MDGVWGLGGLQSRECFGLIKKTAAGPWSLWSTGSPSRRKLRRSASSSEKASRQFIPLPVAPSQKVPGRLVSAVSGSSSLKDIFAAIWAVP